MRSWTRQSPPWALPWVPLFKLQAALGIEDLDAPAPPYLRADPARIAHYRRLIPPDTVGLCWAGLDDGTAMPLEHMRKIFERFPCVSLQGGHQRREMAGTPLIDVLPAGACRANPNWSEDAAVVSCCLAVVTVYTSVMHLEGALGVPAHLCLLPQRSEAGAGARGGRGGASAKQSQEHGVSMRMHAVGIWPRD